MTLIATIIIIMNMNLQEWVNLFPVGKKAYIRRRIGEFEKVNLTESTVRNYANGYRTVNPKKAKHLERATKILSKEFIQYTGGEYVTKHEMLPDIFDNT